MKQQAQPSKWILLEYNSVENLRSSILSRNPPQLFYSAIGPLGAYQHIGIHVTVEGFDLVFPMQANIIQIRERPKSPLLPRGVTLGIAVSDRKRFERLCAFVDGKWIPRIRRTTLRHPIELRASYFVSPFYVSGTTSDISLNGMFLRTNGPLPVVHQGIYLKLYSSRLFPIHLKARVCWVNAIDKQRGMGLFCLGPPRGLRRLSSLIAKSVLRPT